MALASPTKRFGLRPEASQTGNPVPRRERAFPFTS